MLEEVILEIDELESLRLADYLAHSHEEAASKMKISRATFGRIIEKARNKLVDAILHGKAIKIGTEFPQEIREKRAIKCEKCNSMLIKDSLHKNNKCDKCKNNIKEN